MADTEKIHVLVVEPGKFPYEKDIESGLTSLQHEVGGYIECTYPWEDLECGVVCNEEGKINGMELNRALRDEDGSVYDIVAGTFLIVGLGDGDFTSLSPDLCKHFTEEFKYPERFVRINGELNAIKYQPREAVRTPTEER